VAPPPAGGVLAAPDRVADRLLDHLSALQGLRAA
jgi:hypothetical protein